MAWVVVDRNWDECIFENKPKQDKWGNWEDEQQSEVEWYNLVVYLPKGTIKKTNWQGINKYRLSCRTKIGGLKNGNRKFHNK